MVSHDLPRLIVTNQIAFDQRDLHSASEFERVVDFRCRTLANLRQYAIPKINMLCNLMLFENEVKAAVR